MSPRLMGFLSNNVKLEVALRPTGAPTTGVVIDARGYDAALFVIELGSLNTAMTAAVSSDDHPAFTSPTAVPGATVSIGAGDSNKVACIDIVGIPERYLRLAITGAAGGDDFVSASCLLYMRHGVYPIAQPSSATQIAPVQVMGI